MSAAALPAATPPLLAATLLPAALALLSAGIWVDGVAVLLDAADVSPPPDAAS